MDRKVEYDFRRSLFGARILTVSASVEIVDNDGTLHKHRVWRDATKDEAEAFLPFGGRMDSATKRVLNPISRFPAHKEPIVSVLHALAGQEGADGEPYDQMQQAADYISYLERKLLNLFQIINRTD